LIIAWSSLALGDVSDTRNEGLKAFGERKYGLAMRQLKPFAVEGDPEAAYAVGVMYEEGMAVLQDYSLAEAYLLRAAQSGHLEAKVRLAFHLVEKRGGIDRAREAADWFESAARQGHSVAQLNLALIYNNGFARPQNRITAHMWANIASANGSKKAKILRSKIEMQLGAEELEKAQSAAQACFLSNYSRCGETTR
jgi:TPR repeat protein